ncbi:MULTISPECIES: aldo/keto reductase [Mameliella]|uniref:Oxidoreductase, aldo/keto reductase family protein n=1 Tax=Mameliella alba TaxID=561184 RepID=A0A0B3RTZ8_9RHOB|nr:MULTISPECIES: aldo/keto reductase [Mameliella]KHQ51547.1 Oxidoreductase, aldo/keto reductase family protein [Mameliella alba]MDD9731357.1 aldo/keto reductase [Mameliella sp. AT18]ODM50383.1 aldo/keto reductase [Ruegeria sp. PBVC088]
MTLTTLSGDTPARFAFGCMQFGGRASEADSRAMFDACRAAGIAHFDTAHVYTDGASERLLGQFAAAAREDLFIATKANFPGGASRDNIRTSLDESRKRLNMEVIDLYYLHRWDGDTPLEESFETLAELQQAGTIRYIGVSNYAAWQVMKAQGVATRFGTRIDVLQPMYNLVKRQAEVEILPMCASEDILPVPYSPLGGGLLTGKYARGGEGRLTEDDRYANRYARPEMHQAAEALAEIASELGTEAATLAVAWVAAHPSGPAPILSARNAAQLQPSLAGMTCQMDAELYARLSALSPTPPPATDRLEEAS